MRHSSTFNIFLKTFVLLAGLVLTGCSTIQVSHDYDQEVNFSEYKTYGWLEAPGRVEPYRRRNMRNQSSELVEKRIQRATAAGLSSMGYGNTNSSPDFLIAIHANVRERIDMRAWGYGFGGRGFGGWRWGGRRWGWGGAGGRQLDTIRYQEGTIILDIIDAETRELIWRGQAVAEVDRKMTPEKSEKLVKKAVDKMLAKFPPS